MKPLVSFFLLVFLSCFSVYSQSDINQYDENGKRHGVWKKYFPESDQLRYEGQFEHGKEVGTFKYYCEDCKHIPTLIREFKGNDDIAEVKYFTKKGQLVSEGKMDGKKRIGEWLYYHENSKAIMIKEFYKGGELDGIKSTYYANGQLTEEMTFENGVMHGPNLYYSPEGVVLKKLKYIDDQLHGEATYYDAHGNVVIEGFYKDGKKYGLWKYYKDGKIILEETYPKKQK